MKRFVQIIKNKAHWIFEAEERPPYPNNVVIKEITGNSEVQEGWDYNDKTGEFTAPVVPDSVEPQPTLEEMQTQTLLNTEYLVVMSELSNL